MFETNWIIFLILTSFFLILTVSHVIANDPNIVTYGSALIMTVLSLFIMKRTGKYLVTVVLGVVLGSLITQYSINFSAAHSGIADLLWIILISLFAFYGLGSKWGTLVLMINLIGIVWRFVLFPKSFDPINIDSTTAINTIMNIVAASIALSYLLHKILKASVMANRNFQEANIELKLIADEKTILLQEIHHRVKNNLQVVSSLIRMQSFETEDPKAKKMFDATVGRVIAMAQIHEKMYQIDNLSKINLVEYLESLAQDIISSISLETEVKFSIKSDFESIGNRTIVPLALIFNELISNSLKHAFRNSDNGKIDLEICTVDNNTFTLKYNDSGKWEDNIDSKTFGVTLIETFTEQLDGSMERVINDNGTNYFFTLKNID
jgi:two-component sensor histidine kinase